MRVLVVSWEYPPVVVGGLGRHVHHLSVALAAQGHEVVVLSRRPTGTDALTHPTTDTVVEGVRVVAVAEDPPDLEFTRDMMAWTLAMGHAMVRAGLAVTDRDGGRWEPDVVHAHDWLVAHPAIALAQVHDVPLVATMHATEAGRHSGWVAGTLNRQVHSVEWWLAAEADALITCSGSMRDEVTRLFGPDLAEVHTIHNGIDVSTWPYAPRQPHDGPPRLLYAGRLEYEKGVQDLIAAMPRLRRTHPGTVLDILGDGTQETWLRDLARRHRVSRAVRFHGTADHGALLAAMRACDAIVLPSRYEPFGIVALEAAAVGAPLVTSTAGGLGEAVTDGVTGLAFPPGDVAGLAAAVRGVLLDPAAAQRRAAAARERLTAEFSWRLVAQRTTEVYVAAKRRVRHPVGRPEIVTRPLPERDLGPA
ncbi:glycosyltransferase family 4 protein [Williamsia deligens]|uniref:Glycosyltransferase family 4 protein n=1 Tax=Williamsia deligens TaxID=321325 RepID=A0ABW3G0K3_9NOCA|nr:glycosyltransferase family 4 protein [Williamsia deligens]MCP2195026.1 (1->4)-alpha-D-glucan synthase (UDP-glucose) [Williamsia deligens]